MSDIAATKAVDETPIASPATAPETQPTPETAPVEAKSAETPAAALAEAPATTEAAPATEGVAKEGEAKVEATPASEGVLGFKRPSFPNNLRFSKKFFWLSDEPVKSESLSTYVRETKADVAHPTAAWATQTGKGLLFYAKRAEDKATPAGIINLADASEVTKEGAKDFYFKVNGHKYVFAADTTEQQASWIVALEKKIEEAKVTKETVTGSEGYKSSLEKYAKPAALAAPVVAGSSKSASPGPKKSLEAKAKGVVKKDKTDTKSDTSSSSSSDEEKKEKKSRSVSRKRASIFGTLLGKKEEKAEEKKVEEKKEETAEAPIAESSTAVEPIAPATETAAVVPPTEAAAPVSETPEVPKVEETPAAVTATEPAKETPVGESAEAKKAKRNSIFGSFFQKVTSPTTEKSEKDVVPEPLAKDTTVSDTAPKVDTPVEQQPIDTAAVTAPVDAPTEIPAPAAETKETPKETTPVKESKLKGFFKKAEAKVEGKKESKEAVKEEKKAEETPAVAAPTTETPAVTETAPAATESTSADTTPKEKRRTSIFGTLSGTIKKKTGTKTGKTPAEEKKDPIADTTPATEEIKPEPISKEEPKETATEAPAVEAPKVTPQVSATA